MSKLFESKYVPKNQEDYFKLPWYERDLINYFNHLKYKDVSDNPDSYFENVQVVDFEIIHGECRGNKLQGTYKGYKTNESKHLDNYPKKEAKSVLSAAFRNKRDDLWVKHDIVIKYFRENFN